MKSIQNTLLLVLLIGPTSAFGDELGCKFSPAEINAKATNIVKERKKSNTPVEDNMHVYTGFKGKLLTDEIDYRFNGEGILRPLQSASYVIIKPLLLTAKFSRKHDAVYICAHDDDDIMKTHATIYFLHGYGIERSGIKNDISNLFHPQSLVISPIRLSVFGVSQGLHEISAVFGHIPIINILAALPLDILKSIQNDVMGAISEIGGLGVERIVLRADTIEIATGIDINDPTKAKIIKTIPLHGKLINP
jgi:hypothetical protein